MFGTILLALLAILGLSFGITLLTDKKQENDPILGGGMGGIPPIEKENNPQKKQQQKQVKEEQKQTKKEQKQQQKRMKKEQKQLQKQTPKENNNVNDNSTNKMGKEPPIKNTNGNTNEKTQISTKTQKSISKEQAAEKVNINEDKKETEKNDEKIQKIKEMDERMQEKYGFNRGYIIEGPYHASLDTVLERPKEMYKKLDDEEKEFILGNYNMIGGTFTLYEDEKGELQASVHRDKKETETKEVKSETKKSRKMQGLYDDAPEEVKKAYDEIMKKSFTKELDKLEPVEVAFLNNLYKKAFEQIDVKNMTSAEGKFLAVYTKINNRYKKLVKESGGKIYMPGDFTHDRYEKTKNVNEAMMKKANRS